MSHEELVERSRRSIYPILHTPHHCSPERNLDAALRYSLDIVTWTRQASASLLGWSGGTPPTAPRTGQRSAVHVDYTRQHLRGIVDLDSGRRTGETPAVMARVQRSLSPEGSTRVRYPPRASIRDPGQRQLPVLKVALESALVFKADTTTKIRFFVGSASTTWNSPARGSGHRETLAFLRAHGPHGAPGLAMRMEARGNSAVRFARWPFRGQSTD